MERPQPDREEMLRHLFQVRLAEGARHTETDEQLDVHSGRYEDVETDVPGIYEHYKSTPTEPKLYYAGGVKRDRQNDEYVVVYMPLYEADGSRVYARPLDLFLGQVEQDGRTMDRFRHL